MQTYEIVFFDCDSTLSSIEGIDELAIRNGIDVSELTNAAMDGRLPMEDVYRRRLEMIRPTVADFEWLGQLYIDTAIKDARQVVSELQQKNIKVHIISGGLLPGILPFAEYLQIPSAHVHAVPYSPENPEPTFTHPLAMNGGKPATISAVLKSAGISADKALLIGDGVSDLEAKDVVGMFVGFGGVVSRQAVKSASPQYIDAPLLDPLLDIVLQ